VLLPWARQAATLKDGGGVQGDDPGAQPDGSGAALNGKDAEATGPPTPQLDDLFREGAAWSEGRLPEVCKCSLTAAKCAGHLY
jgi:hypothetical protein